MTAFSRPAAFPLPLLTVPDPPWSRSRRSQQRAALLRQTVETTNTVSSALNSLCPPEVSVLEPASNSVSALQSRLSAAVFTAARRWVRRLTPAMRDGRSWLEEPNFSDYLSTAPQLSYSTPPQPRATNHRIQNRPASDGWHC